VSDLVNALSTARTLPQPITLNPLAAFRGRD
jgi:hypothetical protein